MKRNLLLISIIILITQNSGYGQVIKGFYDTYDRALKESQAGNKILLIDFYTDWCKPCKKLDKEVYGAKEFLPYTETVACVKVDFETEEGKKLGEKYDVSNFPTVVFINSQGKEIERITSYFDKSRYIKDVDRIIEGKNTVGVMESKYPGNISYDELFHLTFYFTRRYYNKEKKDKYYKALISMDPNLTRDSTLRITNLQYQLELIGKDYQRIGDAEAFVLAHYAPLYQAELAMRVINGYIGLGQKQRATDFYTKFSASFDPKGDKETIEYLKTMQNTLK